MNNTPSPKLDREQLAAGRLWAAHRHPYLASALFAAPVVEKQGVGFDGKGGVAVDPYWRLYIDPGVVADWSVEQLGSELIHHTGHLLRDHAARGQALGFDEEEIQAWVDASDAEINDDLPSDLARPEQSLMPADLGCDDGRFAEEYFTEGTRRVGEHRDCGSGAHGHDTDWDDSPPEGTDPGVNEDQAELLRRKVAHDVIEQAREQGDLPAGLLRWAEKLVRPKVDWRRTLAAELRRGISEAAGAVDYSHSRPSRRASVMGDVVLPSLRQPVPQIAVVVDTSASMNEQLLAQAVAEIDGVLGSAGVRSDAVRVLSCDTETGTAQRVRSAAQVQLVGGGGTDMTVGIDAAIDLRPRPHVVIVITDGFTPWPSAPPPRCRLVVALVGSGAPTPPAWATVVRVEDEN
jgi:predicted metal-dependent peptidase